MGGYGKAVFSVDFLNLKRDFGAAGDGIADDTQAIINALASGFPIGIPAGTYKVTSQITLPDGAQLFALSRPSRWRGITAPVKILYYGSGSLFKVAPASGGAAENICIEGLHLDGSNAAGAVDGILLDGSAGGGAYIEGVRFTECTITNFPRYQVRTLRTVFDVLFQRCHLNNAGRAADNVVNIEYDGVAGAPGQFTFDHCWIAPYTATKWGIFAGRVNAGDTNSISDLRLIGGTVAPYDPAGTNHGVWVYGGLTVLGTHVEGRVTTSTTCVGIRYTGSNGAHIAPSLVTSCGIGVQIGNPGAKTTEALGCHVLGPVGGNNYGVGGKDIQIVDGGNRIGTVILNTGFYSSSEFILDNLRETTDGVTDELRLLIGYSPGRFQIGGGITLKGPAGYLMFGGQSRASAQFNKTSSTALANIPGLSVTVAAGQTYDFEAILFTASNVSGGVQAAIAGTATATAIIYEGTTFESAAVKAQTRAAALATAVGGVTAVTVARIEIRGTITVNAAGTLTVQFAQNASFGTQSSVLVGSTFTVNQRA